MANTLVRRCPLCGKYLDFQRVNVHDWFPVWMCPVHGQINPDAAPEVK
jgi:hypothetical protein